MNGCMISLYQLYENEELYTKSLYDGVGWTEEVVTFLRYNANKALMNLGQDPLFPDSANDVNLIVMDGYFYRNIKPRFLFSSQ